MKMQRAKLFFRMVIANLCTIIIDCYAVLSVSKSLCYGPLSLYKSLFNGAFWASKNFWFALLYFMMNSYCLLEAAPDASHLNNLVDRLRNCCTLKAASQLLFEYTETIKDDRGRQQAWCGFSREVTRDLAPFIQLFKDELEGGVSEFLTNNYSSHKAMILDRGYTFPGAREQVQPFYYQNLLSESQPLTGERLRPSCLWPEDNEVSLSTPDGDAEITNQPLSEKLRLSCYSGRPHFFTKQLREIIKKYGIAGFFALMESVAVQEITVKQQIQLARQNLYCLEQPTAELGIMQLLLFAVGGTDLCRLFVTEHFWQLRFYYLSILIDLGLLPLLFDKQAIMILANYLLMKREVKLFKRLLAAYERDRSLTAERFSLPTMVIAEDDTQLKSDKKNDFLSSFRSLETVPYQQAMPLVTALQYEGRGFNVATSPLLFLATMFHYEEQLQTADHDGNTPLMHAVKIGNYEAVRIFLADKAVDLSLTNNEGKNALMLAAEYGQLSSLRLLYKKIDELSLGSSESLKKILNQVDCMGHNALMLSLLNRHYDCVHYLLSSYGIDLFFINERGESAMVYALLQDECSLIERLACLLKNRVQVSTESSIESIGAIVDSGLLVLEQLEAIMSYCKENFIAAFPICIKLMRLKSFLILAQENRYKERLLLLEEALILALMRAGRADLLKELLSLLPIKIELARCREGIPFLFVFLDAIARYRDALFLHFLELYEVCRLLVGHSFGQSRESIFIQTQLFSENSIQILVEKIPVILTILEKWSENGFIALEGGPYRYNSILKQLTPFLYALMTGFPLELVFIFFETGAKNFSYFSPGYSLESVIVLSYSCLPQELRDYRIIRKVLDLYGAFLEKDKRGYNVLYYVENYHRALAQADLADVHNFLCLAAIKAEKIAAEERLKKRLFEERAQREKEIDKLVEDFEALE